MNIVILSVVGFFILFGVTNVLTRISAVKYWDISNDIWYVLGLLVRYLMFGIIAVVGPIFYLLFPTLVTFVLSTLTLGGILIIVVGRKWRLTLSSFVYKKTDIASGPPIKQVALNRIFRRFDLAGEETHQKDEDNKENSITDSKKKSKRFIADLFEYFSLIIFNVEKIIGLAVMTLIGILITIIYLYGLLNDVTSLYFLGWMLLGIPLGINRSISQSYDYKEGADADGDRKNVILLLIDDLRRDRLSIHGYHRETSPFLDSIDNLTVFENVIAPGTSSGHSIPSMLSGTFSTVHEYGHNLDLWYLPDIFNDAGYATACISGNPHITDDLFGNRFDWFLYLERGKRYLFDVQRAVTWILGLVGLSYFPIHYYVLNSEFMNDLAKGFIADHRDRPFFLYLHYQDLHEPYLRERQPIINFAEKHDAKINFGDWMTNRDGRRAEWYESEVKNWGYDEKVNHTDSCIEDLFEYLDTQNLLEDTIILITSDHGELLGERDMWGHPDHPFNPLFEIPLLIYDEKMKSQSVESNVSGAEIPNLITSLAKLDVPPNVEDQWIINRDIQSVLSNSSTIDGMLVDYFPSSINLKNYDIPLDYTNIEYHRLLTNTDWKLYDINGKKHLFEYNDIFLDNPVARSEFGSDFENLSNQLGTVIESIERQTRLDQVTDPYGEVTDERVRQQLEDLGYFE